MASLQNWSVELERIVGLTRQGRVNWIGLVAYLSFSFITVLGVTDADFFVADKQTSLPIIGVSIPTYFFFIFSPLLATALYVYLHLHLRKLFEALCSPPPTIDGIMLEDYCPSWLLSDFVLSKRQDGAAKRRPLDWLAGATTVFLVWIAGPFVVLWFWVRSFPAHLETLSIGICVCLLLCLYAGVSSWAKLKLECLKVGKGLTIGFRIRNASVCVIGLVLFSATILKTDGGLRTQLLRLSEINPSTEPVFRGWANSIGWLPSTIVDDVLLASAQLRGVQFGFVPFEDRDHGAAKLKFRKDWCELKGIGYRQCIAIVGTRTSQSERRALSWCEDQSFNSALRCKTTVSALSKEFEDAWRGDRKKFLASGASKRLVSLDFRNASLVGANFAGVDLSGSSFSGADLSDTNFEFSNLSGANLADSNLDRAALIGANLERADLSNASLQSSVLTGASFVSSNLYRAEISGARLTGANFSNSSLVEAGLEGSSFAGADFSFADLTNANLNNSDFSESDFTEARLMGTSASDASFVSAVFLRSDLSGANFDFANFSNALLDGSIGKNSSFQYANFSDASVMGVTWSEANLVGTKWYLANLSESDFQLSVFTNAHISYSVLSNSDFGETSWVSGSIIFSTIDGSNFSSSQALLPSVFRATISDANTAFPSYLTSDERLQISQLCWTAPPRDYASFVEMKSASLFEVRTNKQLGEDLICRSR